MNLPNGPDIDSLVAAVAARLAPGLPNRPTQPDAERPPVGWDPPHQRPDTFWPRRHLALAGLELTQSIQYNGSVGDSYGDDNSIPLVALKPLLVRAYAFVQPGLAEPDTLTGAHVTGELTLSVGDRVIYSTGPTRAAGARLGALKDLSRELWDSEITSFGGGFGRFAVPPLYVNSSLNFVVPAWYCGTGRYYLSVRLWRAGGDGPSSPPQDQVSTGRYIFFMEVRPPRVAIVRVNWSDNAGNVTTPTDAVMLGTMQTAVSMLPFPYFESTILGVSVSSPAAYASVSTGGGCNTAWNNLLTQLAVTRIFTALFQLGDIVFAFVPSVAVPSAAGTYNTGCGQSQGVGASFAGSDGRFAYDFIFAHEMGHVFTCNHVAVPGDPSDDASYPNYGGSKTSIGEVGVNLATIPATLFAPSDTADIMSYQPKQWISPYTYQKILNARDNHQSAPVDPRRVRSLLVLGVRVHRRFDDEDRIEVRAAYRVEAAGVVPRAGDNGISPLSIDLLDAHRRIIATHHCLYTRALASCGCCGGGAAVPLEREPFYDLHEAIEWPGEDVAAIALHNGRESLATIEVGEPPRVELSGPERRDQFLALRLHAEHPRTSPSVVLLFSGDDRATWEPVVFNPANGEVLVEIDRLPGGERCFFRAVATAELCAATADSATFELPLSRRRLHLRLPDGHCPTAPGAVAMGAMFDCRGLGSPAPDAVKWHSDLAGDIGIGYEVAPELREGRHLITVTAPDGRGGSIEERGIIIVSGRPAGVTAQRQLERF
ncbi:MAG: hypothetical protein M3176_12685 [Chloroflexota bacterium]|nr:hypothetical protein [Chloroflexota bacterium]